MREFTQEGMFNELSKVTRAVNKKKFEKMDLPRFGNGGDNAASSTPIDEDKAYLMRMANSPLFIERYARMVGKPVDQVGEEAEAYRQQILNNIETVKINDIGVLPKGVRKRDVWGINGEYSAPLTTEVIAEAQKTIDEIPKFIRKPFQNKLNKEIANYPEHEIFLYIDDPWTKTHETSHASVKGTIHNKNVNKYSFHNLIDALPSERLYKNDEEYYTMPDEQKARIDVTRKYLENKGLYDPVNEPFTEKHYELLRDEYIKGLQGQNKDLPHNVEDLMIPYDKETAIDMFNNFVSNDQKKDITQARLGGLTKFVDGGPNDSLYTFEGRPDSVYKKGADGQWQIKNTSTNGEFITINDPTGSRTKILNAKATPVPRTQNTIPDFNNALLTRGMSPQEYYVQQNQFSPEIAKSQQAAVYKSQIEQEKLRQQKEKEKQDYLASIPKGPVSDNTRTVIPDIAVQAMINKPGADAAKEKQKEFKKELWNNYEKLSTTDKALDRTKAFMVDPFGMTARFLTGDQAYYPGMGEGLLNHDSENYGKYLRAAGYTPGTFEAFDVGNMINPMYWGASIGNNMNKGNYAAAGLEAGLTLLPFMPKNTGSLVKDGGKMLVDDFVRIGEAAKNNKWKINSPIEFNTTSVNPASFNEAKFMDEVSKINNLEQVHDIPNYMVRAVTDPEEANKFLEKYPGKIKRVTSEIWPWTVSENLQSREIQQKMFDESSEFANKWYKKNPEEYNEAVKNLSEKNKMGLNDILDKDELSIVNSIDSQKSLIKENLLKKHSITPSEYWSSKFSDQKLSNTIDDEVKRLFHKDFSLNSNSKSMLDDYEKAMQKVNVHEKEKQALRQSIVDNLDPDFKKKVEGIYELAEKPHPNQIGWTGNIAPREEKLVHYGKNEPSYQSLSNEAKTYLDENFENIGGVKIPNAETITLGSTPDSNNTWHLKFLEPSRPPKHVKTIMERRHPVKLSEPSTWVNIFDKKVPKKIYEYPVIDDSERMLLDVEYRNMVNPKSVGEVNAHEIGHDQQDVANWVNLIQEYNPTFKYNTNHDKNEIAKAFKDAMVEPQLPGTSSRQVGNYDYETWKSGVGELHSELNKSRLNAAQHYMENEGLTMDEAIKVLKRLEADGNDDLYRYYIEASGNLDKHFKPDVDFNTKKMLLQLLPMSAGVIIGGKELLNQETSPLPQQQRFGGNISNLQKFIR